MDQNFHPNEHVILSMNSAAVDIRGIKMVMDEASCRRIIKLIDKHHRSYLRNRTNPIFKIIIILYQFTN